MIDDSWQGSVQFWELLFGTWLAYIFLVIMWERALRQLSLPFTRPRPVRPPSLSIRGASRRVAGMPPPYPAPAA